MVDMNDYIKMFLFVLNVIHEENKLIVALMTDKDMDAEHIKIMDKMFNEAIDGVLKK